MKTTSDLAMVMLDTARLRSGFMLKDSVKFATRIETMLRLGLGVDLNAKVDEEPVFEAPAEVEGAEEEGEEEANAEAEEESAGKDEL